MVEYLNRHGLASELWVQDDPKHRAVIEQLAVPKRIVACDITFNPWTFLCRLRVFRRELRAVRPRVLMAHQTRAALIPLLAARLEGVPYRIYRNGGLPYLGYRGLLRFLLRTLERLNVALATHVLCVSHSNLAAARADGLLPSGTGEVLASGSAVGLDLDEFSADCFTAAAAKEARAQLGLPGSAFVLGYVGRPVRRKGFHLLLDAWNRSGLGAQGGVLLIAGCTPAECRHVPHGDAPGVRGLGYLLDLKPFYAACDAVTLPSEHEGFPNSMLEGAAAGRPLLGTDIPGVRCSVLHGQTGLLVPNKDPAALSAAIGRLAADPDLRARLGRAGRERVEREFSRETVLATLLHFYERIGVTAPEPAEEREPARA